MEKQLRALIIDDSENDAELLRRALQRGGYEVVLERIETADSLNAAFDSQSWDIVFCDYSMPHFNGLEALRIVKRRGLDLPFVFVSGTIGEDIAVAAMREGAHDYIMKSNLKRLVPVVERELKEAQMRRAHRQAEEMVRYLAYYDPPTGLPNRVMLMDRLKESIEKCRQEAKSLAFLLMDIDRFKEINDTLGHHYGDLLLRKVGERLREAIWDRDTVARLGGDEFGVLLALAESEHATLVANKIAKAIEPLFDIEGLPVMVEMSIGIALFPDHGQTAEDLTQRADVAMYAAKESGSGYLIYNAKHDRHSPRRLALMGELRRAIESDQLVLYYQPQIDLQTRRIVGAEALVRWRHPQHGIIPPDQFILPAERTGLIGPLTIWVLRKALGQCQAWREAGLEIAVSVNLSGRNLVDPKFCEEMIRLFQSQTVSPRSITLEITESAIMTDPTHAIEAITKLKALGLRLAIDDYGTGHSSLSYLRRFLADELKVDKSFVANITTDENDAKIVRSTIELAHNLGFKAVAEGVENQETLERLVAFGCDEAQGYYMCRPIPSEQLIPWLKESPWGLKGR
jgi:diguanylate cyclase (GGDEF)-like protein